MSAPLSLISCVFPPFSLSMYFLSVLVIYCVLGFYRFDYFLHDYMVKRNMHMTAEIFREEAGVPDIPAGNEIRIF